MFLKTSYSILDGSVTQNILRSKKKGGGCETSSSSGRRRSLPLRGTYSDNFTCSVEKWYRMDLDTRA